MIIIIIIIIINYYGYWYYHYIILSTVFSFLPFALCVQCSPLPFLLAVAVGAPLEMPISSPGRIWRKNITLAGEEGCIILMVHLGDILFL